MNASLLTVSHRCDEAVDTAMTALFAAAFPFTAILSNTGYLRWKLIGSNFRDQNW
jgi:hypothetical protein